MGEKNYPMHDCPLHVGTLFFFFFLRCPVGVFMCALNWCTHQPPHARATRPRWRLSIFNFLATEMVIYLRVS